MSTRVDLLQALDRWSLCLIVGAAISRELNRASLTGAFSMLAMRVSNCFLASAISAGAEFALGLNCGKGGGASRDGLGSVVSGR